MGRDRSLEEYHAKRDFTRTPEPEGGAAPGGGAGRVFVVQKHDATNLHYDLRLEFEGALKSWAVPRGPSLDPAQKRLAVHVEDHPLEYGSFEGVIPKGEYGGGTVMIWDRGEWEPITDPVKGLARGDLKFRLYGEKLRGRWALVRGKRDSRDWLLLKKEDEEARPIHEFDVLEASPGSVATGRSIERIAADADLVWTEGGAVGDGPASVRPDPRPPGRLDPSGLTNARRRPQPRGLKPMLCTSASAAPEGDAWIHEIKHDGYRVLAFLAGGGVRLVTRNGLDWTDRFGGVARSLARLPVADAVLDGEVVVLDAGGVADFGALQRALSRRDRTGFVYYAFDAPHALGVDLTRTPLIERKAWLERMLGSAPEAGPAVHYGAHIVGNGPIVVRQASGAGVEGIVSKRAASAYEQRRSPSWLKIKFAHRDEFVIVGWTDPEGSRAGLGAVLLGAHDERGRLVWCGKAGSGFTEALLAELSGRLRADGADGPSVVNPPTGAEARGVHWTSPRLVAEVEYAGWTPDGMIRHPVFVGLRDDVDAATVTRPAAAGRLGGAPRAAKVRGVKGGAIVVKPRSPKDATVAGVRITHPERVVYPRAGLKKIDVARYYEGVAHRILPHVVGRPLSLVRCPEGLAGQHFYQRTPGQGWPRSIRAVTVEAGGKTAETSIVIDDLDGLLGLIQHGVLEIHPWSCRIDRPDRPDYLTFDLDPSEEVGWAQVVEGAGLVRELLEHLGLDCLLKTSGGKGVHIVVPILRRSGWDDVKGFAHGVALRLARAAKHLFVATSSKSRRRGRIFVDYLRNQPGATSVAAYSTRAREGAAVSAPIRWDELTPSLAPDRYTVRNLPKRLAALKEDPWGDPPRQGLGPALRRLRSL